MAPRVTCECGECRRCKHRTYMREWTRRNPEKVRAWAHRYRRQNIEVVREKDRERGFRNYDPAKTKARQAVKVALANGSLVREPCEVCGETKVHGHHDDHSVPLAVRWLCSKHHGEVHQVF